jgi:hypothetical protein
MFEGKEAHTKQGHAHGHEEPTAPGSVMKGLTEGRIVHYVLPSGPNTGAHRAAIVVRDWKQANGLVNLQVFYDGANDNPHHDRSPWLGSALYDEKGALGTWHWVEPA